MPLVDRIYHPISGDTSNLIPIHRFTAALVLLANGSINQSQLISMFALVNDEVTDLQSLINKYNTKPDAVSKITFIWLIESAGLLYEDGIINATQYKTILGF